MPKTYRQTRRLSSVLILALIGATLGACSGGDFGRTREDMRSDDMHRWLGAEVTSSVGARPSQFQLTDEERQLRDLAYPLIEPPLSRPAWRSVFGDYKPLPSPWRQTIVFDRTAYGLSANDGGGLYDSNGAPPGARVSGAKKFVNLVEPDREHFCIRACTDPSKRNTGESTKGCEMVVPGNYE